MRKKRKPPKRERAKRNAARFAAGVGLTAWRSNREASPLAKVGKPLSCPTQPIRNLSASEIHDVYRRGGDFRLTGK